MDLSNSAQDVVRCDLCEDAIVQKYCDLCHVNLCISCIGTHISDDYYKHIVVPFEQRKSTLIYPKCTTHQTKRCKFHCKECNVSACSLCSILSDTHRSHTISNLSDIYNAKREVIREDAEKLKSIIFPTYEEVATDIETQLTHLDGEYEKLSTAVTKHGEDCHRIINTIVDKMKAEIGEMKIKHMSILQKHLDEIKEVQHRIEETLLNLNKIEESNEVSRTMEYSSENKEFSKLPPKVQVSLPMLSPLTIDTDQFYKLFGSLAPLATTTEENGYKLRKPKTPTGELLEEPELISTINTGYEKLLSVISLDGEEIWTGASKVSDMKCFNIHGSLIKTIKTNSGRMPNDIAVTVDGDLVYSDGGNRTVYKVKNGQTEEVVRLQGWVPVNLCFTSSGDLLVTMFSDDKAQSKVVRYSGSTEKQTIQFDEEGRPLYSESNTIKYISENRNLDICVADFGAGAVVVVNQNGKLLFGYTGHPSTTKSKPFKPYGITTENQSQILTADFDNHCIHILDQNGVFLHYIDNCDLNRPYGLYIDKSDSLYVAEFYSGNVKKIKYLK